MHTAMTPELPVRPLNILHLVLSFQRGGRRDAIISLARAGRGCRLSPYLITLRGGPGDIADCHSFFQECRQYQIEGLPTPRDVLELRRQCINWHIDIVHAHDASSQFVASMLQLVAPKHRSLMTFHRSLGFESAGWRNKLRNAATLPMISRILTASAERRAHFLAENLVPERKLEVIPLGIDCTRFHPDPATRREVRAELALAEDDLVLVSAGHFGVEKGVHRIIEGVAEAVRIAPELPIHLVVMGTGTEGRQRLLHELGARLLGDRVIFTGQRSDPERVLAAGDLLVHLPGIEAFGLAVVQAMATGLPVVASAVGGLPEIVLPGETGELVPAEASPRQVAEALVTILSDPARRSALGLAAESRVTSHFSMELAASRHRALYDRILSLPGHR